MPATIHLPDPALAPGFRDSLRGMAQLRLSEVVPGYGVVEPSEGDGAVYPYLTAHRLCDAGTDLSDAGTWEPLKQSPSYEPDFSPPTSIGGEPDENWRERLHQWGREIGERGVPGSDFEAIQSHIRAHTKAMHERHRR